MARKSPTTNFERNYDSIFKQTKLQSNLRENFNNEKSSFGNNANTLSYITEMAGKRAYSHSKRLAKINEALSGKNLSDSERSYVQSVLNTQYQHIKSTARDGRKVKDFSETAKKAYQLRNNIQTDTGYAQFETRTKYLENKEKIIPVHFPKPSPSIPIEIKHSSNLENKVTQVSFLTKAGNNLAKLAASVLIGATLLYTACTPSPDPKDVRIKILEKEKTELSMKLLNTDINYDRTMRELTEKYNSATNDLATTQTNYSSATNALDKTETKLNNIQGDLGSSIIRNIEMTNQLGSANLKLLSASNQLHTATNQVSQLQGHLSTAKTDLTSAKESKRKTEEQLAKERKAHSETGNNLQRTTGALEARTRDYSTATNNLATSTRNLGNTAIELATLKSNYNLALNNNAQISAELTSNARALAVEKSTLADRLDELRKATNDLAKVQLQYTVVNHAVTRLQEGLQKRTVELKKTSNSLASLKRDYSTATNLLDIANIDLKAKNVRLLDTQSRLTTAEKTISKYHAVEEAARQKEQSRLEEGINVDKLVSVSPIKFPLSIFQLDKKGKKLENVKEIVYFGDGLVDTFQELRTFARAIGSSFTSTNHVHDAVIPIWFGDAKLSDTETRNTLNQVPRQDLLNLGGFLQATSTNSGITTFTNSKGNIYIMGPTKKLNQIIGNNK